MDVERTIEYILQMQAQSEVRMAKADERMDKFAKLPPLMGRRAAPDAAPASDPSTGGTTEN